MGISSPNNEDLAKKVKTPLWTFLGLVLFVILIIGTISNTNNQYERNQYLISNPKKNDVYEVLTKNSNYALIKIINVNGDSIFILKSKYSSNRISGLSEIIRKGDEAYINEPIVVLKKNLNQMFIDKKIINIIRNFK